MDLYCSDHEGYCSHNFFPVLRPNVYCVEKKNKKLFQQLVVGSDY